MNRIYPGILLLAAAASALIPAGLAASDSSLHSGKDSLKGPRADESVEDAQSDAVANSVVKVYTTLSRPDLSKPWGRLPPKEETGSGVVMEGKRILTCAHDVLYSSELQIKGNQAGDKVTAHVVAVSPELDLALLRLDDESFFDSHRALPRSTALPKARDLLSVYGFPYDGVNVSIVKATITGIEFTRYRYPVSGVRVRINQSIEPGSSGGPAMDGDRFIGIGGQVAASQGASGYSYVVPNQEIGLFLDGVAKGGYAGKPTLFDEFQKLENPALRAYLRLDPKFHGILATGPGEGAGGPATPLRSWDVVTRIGGEPVDDQATVRLGESERISFQYLVQTSESAGLLPITVVRDGRELPLKLPVERNRRLLINELEGEYPSYFIFGPIVFSVVTRDLTHRISTTKGLSSVLAYRGSPLETRLSDLPAFAGEQLVYVPCPLFPHKLAKGYGDPSLLVVKSVNAIPIRNLLHLVQVLRDSKDPFVTVEFWEKESEILVFPREASIEATDNILGDNGVRNQGSPDTLAVWNAKPSR